MTTTATTPEGLNPRFRKFLIAAAFAILLTGVFTAAQFIPSPDWLFARNGTLVIESNPLGVPVLVNGRAQGVTPLTLKVEAGRHEVELRGPGGQISCSSRAAIASPSTSSSLHAPTDSYN
jgi:hypothetical protein